MASRTFASSLLRSYLGRRLLLAAAHGRHPRPAGPPEVLIRVFSARFASTAAPPPAAAAEEKEREGGGGGDAGEPKAMITSYWGIGRSKLVKEDGTEWRWSCFRPWDTYKSDLSIDLKKHHVPTTFLDKLAFWTVKALRVPTDIFFQRRYGCRAMMLETVAAVPGMVGGMLLHLRSLRRFEHSGGWIRALLEEAENERMHLMTFMEVSQPRWYERALVIAVQGVFFNLPPGLRDLPQVRPQGGRLSRRGGHPLLHGVPKGARHGGHRERPRPRHCYRLLAPAARRHPP
ncbi:ubiquinol oxidase 2, mitochondrial-like [Iris pallida]|uniref:Ubiquinol oxidase n=1 Tax=Iris pallida TaxID=29817 RepID=A0AAX6G4F9_IRIPA|nr:ubiquinol oxidase 2, mitochondrial-like [Iris pallida]